MQYSPVKRGALDHSGNTNQGIALADCFRLLQKYSAHVSERFGGLIHDLHSYAVAGNGLLQHNRCDRCDLGTCDLAAGDRVPHHCSAQIRHSHCFWDLVSKTCACIVRPVRSQGCLDAAKPQIPASSFVPEKRPHTPDAWHPPIWSAALNPRTGACVHNKTPGRCCGKVSNVPLLDAP